MRFQYLVILVSLTDFSLGQNNTLVQSGKNESQPIQINVTPKTIPLTTTARILTNASTRAHQNATGENATTTEDSSSSGLGSFFSILSPLIPDKVTFVQVELGSNCSIQSDCKINGSICLEGKCSCREQFVVNWNNRECLHKAKSLGDNCIEDAQCRVGLEKTVGSVMCLSQKCGCGPNTKYLEKENKCVQANVGLGANCEADTSCTVADSICTQNVCACKPGSLPSPENDKCIQAAKKIGGSCTDDAQCQEQLGDFSMCEDGSCNCKPNYHSDWNFTRCLEDKELGAACSRPDECMTHSDWKSGASRDCVNGLCTCLSESCREQAGLRSTSSATTTFFQFTLIIPIIYSSFS